VTTETVERDTFEGRFRQCYRCGEWWPIEPDRDGDGQLVRFWLPQQGRRCYACQLELNRQRLRDRRTAAGA
jgi:hypothetical protein